MTPFAPFVQPDTGVDPADRIDAAAAAELLGIPLSSFNASRREMQLVRDRSTGRLLPYPDFGRDALGNVLNDDERRRREKEFDARHLLVLPEWGGIRYPRCAWTYSRRRCEAIRNQDVAGLEQPAWVAAD